jgi:5-methylcytosine-specific restriction endonuclease McrA
MKINDINRPGEKKTQTRYSPDRFYQSSEWKKTRQIHFSSSTTVSKEDYQKILTINPGLKYTGGNISNLFCLQCYKEGRLKEGNQVDHIVRIKDGGSRHGKDNLQSLCVTHHAQKSANEGKKK